MILITENTNFFKKGDVIKENFNLLEEGVEIGEEKHFLNKKKFINLNEALTPNDEKRIREIIKTQLRYIFWQLYTKSPIIIGNITS